MVLQKLENNAITKLCVKVTAFPFMKFGFFIRIARLFFSFGMDVSFFLLYEGKCYIRNAYKICFGSISFEKILICKDAGS